MSKQLSVQISPELQADLYDWGDESGAMLIEGYNLVHVSYEELRQIIWQLEQLKGTA